MTSDHQRDRLDRLISHEDIRQLVARYCWALDTLDRDLLATVFTVDATAHLGRGTQNGFDEIWNWINGVLSSLDLSQHIVGSQLIELGQDGTTGTSRCYFTAQHVRKTADTPTSPGAQYIVAGRYEDTVIHTSDGWRITHRTLTVMWASGNPAVIAP